MDIFQKTKHKSSKLSQVKFMKEIKKIIAEESEQNLKSTIQENNDLLKDILEKDIIKDLVVWFNDKINNNHSDKIKKIAEWINIWTLYLHLEENFNSSKLRKYDRGDIVHLNFGFNVSSELGGSHYGLIIEKNNDKTSDTVIAVPLRSENGQKDEKVVFNELNKNEVLLGKNLIPIGEAKNNYSIAKVNQMRAIAKLRITAPKKDDDIVYPLDKDVRSEILNKIDREVAKLILK